MALLLLFQETENNLLTKYYSFVPKERCVIQSHFKCQDLIKYTVTLWKVTKKLGIKFGEMKANVKYKYNYLVVFKVT